MVSEDYQQPMPDIVLKESDSFVNDHGAQDEYVEVDTPPPLEDTSDFRKGKGRFHTFFVVITSLPSRARPCHLPPLPTHFLLPCSTGYPSPSSSLDVDHKNNNFESKPK